MESQNNILIIEDEVSIRDILKLALEIQGYSVFTASNGQEGLESLQSIPRPSLILLDLMMPVMDGWGFMDAFTKMDAYNQIPIVVISAYNDKARPIAANEFIKKPVDLETLRKVAQRNCLATQAKSSGS